MKKNRLFLMPLIAATLSLGSCSSDSPDMGGNETFKGDQAFMKVRISMANDPGTRSVTDNGFENGSVKEQYIKTLGFKFYKADGTFLAYGESQGPITPDEQTPNGGNVEAIANAVIALTIKEGEEKPKYVVAFVNCTDTDWKLGKDNELSLNATPKSDLSYQTKNYGNDDDGYAMTSSNHDSNGYLTEVDPEKFFETEAAAKLDENPVDIYVERIAAKVTVENSTPTNSVEKGDYTFKFTVKGFVLGGTNKSSYLIKNLDPNWNTTAPWTGWSGDYRCFWAKDINYDYTEIQGELNYAKYNDSYSPGTYQYCHENTFPASGDNSILNPYNVQPFVYITGTYEVTKGTEIVTEDLFSYAGNIYPATEMINIMQNAIGGVLYKKNETNDTYDKVDLNNEGLVEIMASDANHIILQLKEEKGEDNNITYPDLTKYWIKNGDSFREATNNDIEAVNELLASPIKANGFKYVKDNGHLAYFPVLIEHLNFQNNTADKTYTRAEQPVGAYGIVRNHIYRLEINSITNLGIGVFDPEQIIYPDINTKTYYLGARIKILSWKVVKQGVDL